MKNSVIAATLALAVVLGGVAPVANAQTAVTTTTVNAAGTAELMAQIKKLQSMLELYHGSMKMRIKDDCKQATSTAATASSSSSTMAACVKSEIKSKVEDKKTEVKNKIKDRMGTSSKATSTQDKDRGAMATSSRLGQRAQKEIAKAEAELAEIKSEFGSSTQPQAVVTLIRNGESKLAEAKARFGEGKFVVAASLAKSAERSAKRADSLYEKSRDDDEDDN